MHKISATQRKVLEAMYAGGRLEYGQYGGILGFIYYAQGTGADVVHGNTIKALLKRQYIRQDGRTLVISDDGCDAIGCIAISELG